MKSPSKPASRCQPMAESVSPAASANTANTASSARVRKLGMVKLARSQPAAAASRSGNAMTTRISAIILTNLQKKERPPWNKAAALGKPAAALFQVARYGGEGRRQLGADGGHTGDDDDSDESGNQAILDGGGARFIANETRDEVHISLQL